VNNFLEKIFVSQLDFEGADNSERFLKSFLDLYRIELFKDGLDLILTKIKEKNLRFEIRITKGWDTNVGCFLTEKKSFYDKTLDKFFQKKSLKIILRQLSCNVMTHEMAHALEFESGINLGEEFRQAIGFDMKNQEPQILTLKGEVKRLMVDALKAYPAHQFLSELFARYFELLSVSRNVCEVGSFATSDVMWFFENTTNFIEKIFNPKIKSKIDPEIAAMTSEIVAQVKLSEPHQKFQERVESFRSKSENSGKISWSKNVKSNSAWQESWEKHRELEDKK
jgi:hypothetical protein